MSPGSSRDIPGPSSLTVHEAYLYPGRNSGQLRVMPELKSLPSWHLCRQVANIVPSPQVEGKDTFAKEWSSGVIVLSGECSVFQSLQPTCRSLPKTVSG